MESKQLPVFELKIEDPSQDGVFAVSLVDSPAIMREFILQNSEVKHQIKFQNQKEKRTATGALLIPNQLVYRVINNQECFVFYTAETIEKIRNNFFKNQFTNKVTIQHEADLSGVYLIESWITGNKPGKEVELGLDNLPPGTWVGTYYFDNSAEEVYQEFVKSGIVKGFSIEGLFALSPSSTVTIQQEDEYSKLIKQLELLLK